MSWEGRRGRITGTKGGMLERENARETCSKGRETGHLQVSWEGEGDHTEGTTLREREQEAVLAMQNGATEQTVWNTERSRSVAICHAASSLASHSHALLANLHPLLALLLPYPFC